MQVERLQGMDGMQLNSMPEQSRNQDKKKGPLPKKRTLLS